MSEVKHYVVFLPSGEVTKCVMCPEDMIEMQLNTDESYLLSDTVDDSKVMVDTSQTPPVVVNKVDVPFTQDKLSIVADSVDECDISGLPDPCTVTWPDDVVDEVSGGSIQFSTDYPGTYVIKLVTSIHLQTEVHIEATAVV